MAKHRTRGTRGQEIVKAQPQTPLPDRTVQRSVVGFGAPGGGYLSSIRQASSGVPVDEMTALNLTAFWRGINVLAGDIAKLPLEVFRHLENGKGKQPDYSHPVYRLLCYPNSHQTGRKLRFAAAVHLVLFQNAYLEILRDPETGDPAELHLLDPRLIKPYMDGGRLLYKIHNGSPYSGNKVLLAENVLHFTGFSMNGINGMSGVGTCNDSLGLGLAVQEYAATLFANNAQPSGVVECPPGWDEVARTNFRENWQEQHGGVKGSNKVAILEEGAKFVATTFNPEQLQLLSVREFSVIEVARILGLPGSKLGDMSHEASRSLAESNRDYYETSLLPYLVGIEDEYAFKLFGVQDRSIYFVKHDMASLMRPDELTRAQTNEIRMRNGALTINEWRAEDGRNPFAEDGRVLPLNMSVVTDTEVQTEVPEDDDPVTEPAPQPEVQPVVPDVATAARSIARDAVQRIARREAKNLHRHCSTEVDPAWVDGYYDRESSVWTEALAPALGLYGIAIGSRVDVRQVVDDVIARSRAEVQTTTDLAGLLTRWEQHKADDVLMQLEAAE